MNKQKHDENMKKVEERNKQEKKMKEFQDMLDSRKKSDLIDDMPIYNGFYK